MSKRLRLPLLIGGTLLLLTVAWFWAQHLRGPDRAAKQFLDAIQLGNTGAVYRLTMDHERKHLGLTDKAVRRTLNEMLYHRVALVRWMRSSTSSNDQYRAQNWYAMHVAWVDGTNLRPLPSNSFNGELITVVDVFKSMDGKWQISFTRFVRDWLTINFTSPEFRKSGAIKPDRVLRMRSSRRALLRSWGLPEAHVDPALVKQNGTLTALLRVPAHDPLSLHKPGVRP